MQAEIAALRFGLGARPGELATVRTDPRGWLRDQIRGAVPIQSGTALAASDQILSAFLAAREQRRELKAAVSAGDAVIPAAQPGNAQPPRMDAQLLRLDAQPPRQDAQPPRQDAQPPRQDAQPPRQDAQPLRLMYLSHYKDQVLARAQSAAATTRPFAERLVHFWSNHFAVSADKGIVTGIAGTLENEAIRPHVNGNFQDLLLGVERHPAMIAFLDNQGSVGPSSPAARLASLRGSDRKLGINENLAREIMELHTLGVGSGYAQADVTAFAKVLSGWSIGGVRGRLNGGRPGAFLFRENLHEPGPQTVLGRRFDQSGEAQGEAVLHHLAQHPATARFIATKLARHFIADEPPASAVAQIERAFKRSEGDLAAVYQALIDCPECWNSPPRKFKTPEDLVFSTWRAFDAVPGEPAEVIRSFEFLGQRQYTPGSPAGWPDTARSWDGSDALMHRVLWASRVGEKFERGIDPLEVASNALGAFVRPETLTALKRASAGSQALALLVMSPEFQRR